MKFNNASVLKLGELVMGDDGSIKMVRSIIPSVGESCRTLSTQKFRHITNTCR